MDSTAITRLIARYGLISDQVDAAELAVILNELVRVRSVPGVVVEFGCYRGTTSLYIRRVLDALGDSREFHVYDSFAGLPDKTDEDRSPAGEQFVAGELSASKKAFIAEFKKAGLKPPHVHKAWFDDLAAADVPALIAFAFLDGDYYESVRTSLRLIEGKLAPGAVVIVDDYASEALPGAAKAVNEWLLGHHGHLASIASLALIRF